MSSFRRRLSGAALAVCGALLLLPAAGQAAQVFGSDLLNPPNQPDCPALIGPCTIAAAVEVPAEGVLSSAGAPIDGVITKFRVRAKVESPTQATLRVAAVTPEGTPADTATAIAGGTGPTVTLQTAADDAPPQEFAARLTVKKGEHLALEGSGLIATYDSSGDRFSYGFAPPLVAGTARKSSEALGQLLVQATVEPDADGDGFGDETQDACPTQKTGGAPCDNTKPGLTGLRVHGATFSYRLSETATVRISLARKSRGRFRQVGRGFAGPGKQGLDKVALPRARKLAAGSYRLTVTATDAVGNKTVRSFGFSLGRK